MKSRLLLISVLLTTAALAQGAPAPAEPAPDAKTMPCQSKDAPEGCKMMSAAEIKMHEEKMRGMKDRKSCMAYMEEHHKAMQERAAKAGQTLPEKPKGQGCMGMK